MGAKINHTNSRHRCTHHTPSAIDTRSPALPATCCTHQTHTHSHTPYARTTAAAATFCLEECQITTRRAAAPSADRTVGRRSYGLEFRESVSLPHTLTHTHTHTCTYAQGRFPGGKFRFGQPKMPLLHHCFPGHQKKASQYTFPRCTAN